ncbi:MAG TPA: type II toxin-antitoxin system VapC family toxin [Terriglobales bacterium]|nr:type II toxin-antitoxin system VapC family toxin [Terriglobales bacterium]
MILLDTHVLVWFLNGDPRLPDAVKTIILDEPQVYVSDVSFWEIGIKARLPKRGSAFLLKGRPIETEEDVRKIVNECGVQGFLTLPITTEAILLAPFLGGEHKDPFDRMLAAQSLVPSFMTLVSADKVFDTLSPNLNRYWPGESGDDAAKRKKPSKRAT